MGLRQRMTVMGFKHSGGLQIQNNSGGFQTHIVSGGLQTENRSGGLQKKNNVGGFRPTTTVVGDWWASEKKRRTSVVGELRTNNDSHGHHVEDKW